MPAEYVISLDQNVIRVIYRGKPEYEATRAMLVEVGRLAAESRTCRVLFDLRQGDSDGAYVATVRHAEEASAVRIDRSFRIALLGSADAPMLRYFEAVAVNRGFQVRAFVDEAAAADWLQAES